MDRFVSRQSFVRAALWMSLFLLTVPCLGCQALLRTVAYLVEGTDEPADYNGLKHQRVAVVVRPSGRGASADEDYGARELAQKIGAQLKANVSGIKVIDQQEVDRWKDNVTNTDQDDYKALGAALKADRVLAVELEEFRLNDNSTSLYTGRCDYRIVVYDLADKTGEAVWKHDPNEAMVYPPNHGIPIGNRSRAAFRKIFVTALAEEISQHFYAHDATAHFARDSESLKDH